MASIGLFYGSSTCYTEIVAEEIVEQLSLLAPSVTLELHNIAQTPVQQLQSYEFIICGIPTWDYGEIQEDWDNVWDDLITLDLRGVNAAVFGLGDQVGYPQWFQDAMGFLAKQLLACGAQLSGYWSTQGYTYQTSLALTEGDAFFYGLALDEENQRELTDARLDQWLRALLTAWNLSP